MLQFFFFHQFTLLKKEDALKDVLRKIARFHKVCNGRKPKRITYHGYFAASPLRSIIKITQAKRKRRRGRRGKGKKPRLTKKSLWRRDENTWNSTNFPNNHTQMGIPPIRIDCPLSPPPIPAPSSAESAYLGAREPSQRALSNRISSQPKVIRHPRRGGG